MPRSLQNSPPRSRSEQTTEHGVARDRPGENGGNGTVPDTSMPRAARLAGSGAAVEVLDEDIRWISDTFDGPSRLAESNSAFGGFVDGRLVSVAVPFHVGERFEELGVVTAEAHRGAGWSSSCSAAVVADTNREVERRAGRRHPTTSPAGGSRPSSGFARRVKGCTSWPAS